MVSPMGQPRPWAQNREFLQGLRDNFNQYVPGGSRSGWPPGHGDTCGGRATLNAWEIPLYADDHGYDISLDAARQPRYELSPKVFEVPDYLRGAQQAGYVSGSNEPVVSADDLNLAIEQSGE